MNLHLLTRGSYSLANDTAHFVAVDIRDQHGQIVGDGPQQMFFFGKLCLIELQRLNRAALRRERTPDQESDGRDMTPAQKSRPVNRRPACIAVLCSPRHTRSLSSSFPLIC
jgi:hypothetical protein